MSSIKSNLSNSPSKKTSTVRYEKYLSIGIAVLRRERVGFCDWQGGFREGCELQVRQVGDWLLLLLFLSGGVVEGCERGEVGFDVEAWELGEVHQLRDEQCEQSPKREKSNKFKTVVTPPDGNFHPRSSQRFLCWIVSDKENVPVKKGSGPSSPHTTNIVTSP
jgi:hypothetical protein